MGPGGGPGREGPDGPGQPGYGREGLPAPGYYGPPAAPGELAGRAIKDMEPLPEAPAFIIYIATGDETGPGKVYQCDEHGRVLGVVNLPFTPTGMAMHRDKNLILALPRDGGSIVKIDDTGKVSTLLSKDSTLVHPVDVAVGGDSDSVVVADNIGDVLALTTCEGNRPQVYHRFEGQKWAAQDMSVAVTRDKHVIFGTDGGKGIFRFAGDAASAQSKPLLPEPGGVAADTKTLRWAATQPPNQVYVFEGETLIKKLRLPPGKSIYRQGLLSFAPCGSVCVAARDNDTTTERPWLFMYNIEEDKVRSLFPWTRERMTDFVVGPRNPWDVNRRPQVESIY